MPENESKPRVSDAPVTKLKEEKIKEPRGPLVTAEGVSQFLFVVLVSLFFYLMICGVVYGAFYCATHVRFNWNYDVTVKLDDSSKKPPKYTTSRDLVFKDESEIPYISMAKLALSLDLSSMGDAKQIKFYKTNDLENYVVFTHRSKEVVINGTESAGAFLLERFYGEKNEVIYQLCIDRKGKLLACRRLNEGSANSSELNVRRLVENALLVSASSVILAHNHPSGIALPSQEDYVATDLAQQALRVVGVELLDHIIVADDDYVSLADSGILERWR